LWCPSKVAADDDQRECSDDDLRENALSHCADELIAQSLLTNKDNIGIDTVEELLSFVEGPLTAQSAVRFLTVLDNYNWEEFEYTGDYKTFVAEFVMENLDVDMEDAWKYPEEDLKDAEEKLNVAEEKLEGVDLDSFFVR